jgi:hypothetical protein
VTSATQGLVRVAGGKRPRETLLDSVLRIVAVPQARGHGSPALPEPLTVDALDQSGIDDRRGCRPAAYVRDVYRHGNLYSR